MSIINENISYSVNVENEEDALKWLKETRERVAKEGRTVKNVSIYSQQAYSSKGKPTHDYFHASVSTFNGTKISDHFKTDNDLDDDII